MDCRPIQGGLAVSSPPLGVLAAADPQQSTLTPSVQRSGFSQLPWLLVGEEQVVAATAAVADQPVPLHQKGVEANRVTALMIRLLDPPIPAEWAQRFLAVALGVGWPPPDRWATVGQALGAVTQMAAAAARAFMAVGVARLTLGLIPLLRCRAVVVEELGLHG
jgi:hypothetical protein